MHVYIIEKQEGFSRNLKRHPHPHFYYFFLEIVSFSLDISAATNKNPTRTDMIVTSFIGSIVKYPTRRTTTAK